jgi:hypothetical protein
MESPTPPAGSNPTVMCGTPSGGSDPTMWPPPRDKTFRCGPTWGIDSHNVVSFAYSLKACCRLKRQSMKNGCDGIILHKDYNIQALDLL